MNGGPESLNWTSTGNDILGRACEYYGGERTWRALRLIRLVPEGLTGMLPWVKGAGKTFRLPSVFEIAPHERQTRFLDYPDADHTGVFDNGAVRIERRDGQVVLAAAEHRRSFRGFAAYRRWSPLDALYFFGYALSHYHSLPFTLSDARLVTAKPASPRRPLDVLDVELPDDLPTHSRRQTFYFDKSGRLVRHDYHAEIVGAWARGAHFWKRQTSCNGFPISMERLVVGRLGKTPYPLTALYATFAGAEVELDFSGAAPAPSGRQNDGCPRSSFDGPG
ncbi:MAG: hypothetical protein EOO73_34880 [Myxococcales bacterium]|nr:MAG: hypothetical protein EOO73_34880 [Myxococcales bacterium]